MEALFFETILYLFRIPGALFLAAISRKDFDHWVERANNLGVAATGAAVIALFVLVATWVSG
jgi:hypothetical protein